MPWTTTCGTRSPHAATTAPQRSWRRRTSSPSGCSTASRATRPVSSATSPASCPTPRDRTGGITVTDRLITHLRHVDLAVPDLARQQDFFTGAWGLTAEHGDTGISFLAAEGSPE